MRCFSKAVFSAGRALIDTQFQAFASNLPPEIAGVSGHDASEAAAAFLQQQLVTQKGVLISLDYSQCYDRMQVPLVLEFLRRIQWGRSLFLFKWQLFGKQNDSLNSTNMFTHRR